MPKRDPGEVFESIDVGEVTECWEWRGAVNSKNLPSFKFEGKTYTAYRFVFQLVHNVLLNNDEYILHSCDNPMCCNPHHLRAGTHQENMNDMKERERHGMPKTVRNAIRNLAEKGITQEIIAERYGISQQQVSKIIAAKE